MQYKTGGGLETEGVEDKKVTGERRHYQVNSWDVNECRQGACAS